MNSNKDTQSSRQKPSSEPAKGEIEKELDSSDEIRITVIGRKTGHKHTTPIWFVREGDRMLLLPVSGTDTNWFRNLEKNSELTISVGKLTFVRRARPTKDKNFAKEVADKFRAKYGADQVKKYYSKFDAAVELKI